MDRAVVDLESIQRIIPVILAVPPQANAMSGRAKVAFLSEHARKALRLSAGISRLALKTPHKNENGAPLPSDGIFWSISHKPKYVAGLVSTVPIGIDIEPVKPRKTKGLFFKIAGRREWDLVGGPSWSYFFRFWTAKEAVLKASGIGLQDLSQCRIIRIVDKHHLSIGYAGQTWRVAHAFFDNHIASVVYHARGIEWHIA